MVGHRRRIVLGKHTGKHVFTGYGVRYDLALKDEEYLEELCAYHISGQLRIAPEHFSRQVTNAMCKPGREVYEKFTQKFTELNRKCGKEQYIVNYLMSGHPGCTLEDMIEMAEYVRDHGVQKDLNTILSINWIKF